MSALLILTLLLTPQDEQRIPRVSKGDYQAAVRDLKKAVDLINEDPSAAIEKVSGILSNSKITKVECRLKIEIASQEFEYADFFPYQVRGKARIALSKKATLQAREGILTAAMEDLKTSSDKKVPGSPELYKEAETLLAKAKADIEAEKKPEDPYTLLKPKFDNHLTNRRYRSAVTYVAKECGALTEEQRQGMLAEAEDACGTWVEGSLRNLNRNLGDPSIRAFSDLKDTAFKRQFEDFVPAEAELTEKAAQDPTLVYARKAVKVLKSIQSGQMRVEDVMASALEAIALEPERENFWFRYMALLACESCETAVTKRAKDAETLGKSERARLQAEADKALATWKGFAEKLDAKVIENHPDVAKGNARLDDAMKLFPVELTQLSTFDIDKCFLGDAGTELKAVEEGLLTLVSNLTDIRRVAIESRQELYTKLINASTLRRFMAGVTEEQVIRDLFQYRSDLSKAGGPINPGLYGPRVKKVFDSLKM